MGRFPKFIVSTISLQSLAYYVTDGFDHLSRFCRCLQVISAGTPNPVICGLHHRGPFPVRGQSMMTVPRGRSPLVSRAVAVSRIPGGEGRRGRASCSPAGGRRRSRGALLRGGEALE